MFCETLDLHHDSKKADLLADMKEDGEKDENLLSFINPLFGDDLQKTISDIYSKKKTFNKGNNFQQKLCFELKKVEMILKTPEGSIQRV